MDCLLAHAYSCHSRLITSNNDSPDRWRRISSIGKLSTLVEMPDYPQDSVVGLVYTRILHPRAPSRMCSVADALLLATVGIEGFDTSQPPFLSTRSARYPRAINNG